MVTSKIYLNCLEIRAWTHNFYNRKYTEFDSPGPTLNRLDSRIHTYVGGVVWHSFTYFLYAYFTVHLPLTPLEDVMKSHDVFNGVMLEIYRQ